jgi:hypothetical protein
MQGLSLCYINDFWNASSLFSVLFAKGKVLGELVEYVNTELQKIDNGTGTVQIKWL